jgi:isoprenylcysteine carboxyl methyltransferase (ICMT) family protein YpbQ
MESKLEKLYRTKEFNPKVEYEEAKSLKYFKLFQTAICIISSIEFSEISLQFQFITVNIVIGLSLIVIGVYLRITAIKTLGKYWSYNVRILANHEIIDRGIYHYIKHPAYLGNIFILGIFLICNLYASLLISFIFLSGFNYWRIRLENKLLKDLRYKKRENYIHTTKAIKNRRLGYSRNYRALK